MSPRKPLKSQTNTNSRAASTYKPKALEKKRLTRKEWGSLKRRLETRVAKARRGPTVITGARVVGRIRISRGGLGRSSERWMIEDLEDFRKTLFQMIYLLKLTKWARMWPWWTTREWSWIQPNMILFLPMTSYQDLRLTLRYHNPPSWISHSISATNLQTHILKMNFHWYTQHKINLASRNLLNTQQIYSPRNRDKKTSSNKLKSSRWRSIQSLFNPVKTG